MGGFVQQSITKTAVRELTTPIADITTFNTLVFGIISGNPWSCTAYDVGGVPQNPVSKSREGYTARIEFEDIEEAIVSYDKALALDPNYTSAWNNRGIRSNEDA
ncbi:MAG TPA: tetratricopeptide repeat protein [Methanoregulaceae archaeon]|nr:MAG: tetratricopeptide repeat protein [Methanolinea sp.]HON82373.1 tetratricopeptide repeat protein [Methanoregulaceae archaeon]HPD11224.1 tetratricopeptide repeat protein [Methanoregulaceae archaeon]